MPNFEAKGKHYETGKMLHRTYQVPTETEALHRALADGMIVEDIRLAPDEPPTDKQLAYAKDLGINIPPSMIKDEISDAIAAQRGHDKPASEKHRTIAKKYGVESTQYCGKKSLFDRIFTALKADGREGDLAAWFTYRIYRNLMHGQDGGPVDTPDHPLIGEIGNDLSKFDNVIQSIKRYDGRDLIWFGEWTAPDGRTYQGGSDRTIAYKMAAAALRQRIEFPAQSKAEPDVTKRNGNGAALSGSIRNCHDCGKPISKSAGRCPHCGARHDYGSYAWALILAIVLAVFISMIFQCGE